MDAASVSVEASFFELGGNSLKAVMLAREVTEALGHAVSAADVLQRPTIASLAAAEGVSTQQLPPLVRCVDAAALLSSEHPVSWNQSQLLTVHLSGGAGAAYNIPVAHWLRGALDVSALRAALVAVVERHSVLRTTYKLCLLYTSPSPRDS